MARTYSQGVHGLRGGGRIRETRTWSISGLIFAALFALFAIGCLVWALMGQWVATVFVFMATLPFSLLPYLLLSLLRGSLGMSYEVLNWALFAMTCVIGVVEFYWIGWWMERPFRR